MKASIEEQVSRLLDLGYHEAAGLDAAEFKRYVPIENRERALLVVSERCVSIPKQCELLRIKHEIKSFNEHADIVNLPRTYIYAVLDPDDGSENVGLHSDFVLPNFEVENRRPCSTVEILAIYREFYFHKRKQLRELRFIDAFSSRVKEDLVPTLWFDNNSKRGEIVVRLIAFAPIDQKQRNHSSIASCRL